MLSKDDLKQIKIIVAGEVGNQTILQNKGFSGKFNSLTEEVKGIKKDILNVQKDLDTVIQFFDRDYLELCGRVERIEKHLGITALT